MHFRMSGKKTALSKKKTHTKQQLSIFPSYLIKDPLRAAGSWLPPSLRSGIFAARSPLKRLRKMGQDVQM